MPNALARATSPYLLQHKDNPVAWREWNPDTLAEARRRDRPILLSVGYAACHWCHVMARESFEDPDTAAVINARFLPVKVDREERPDIDTLYQQALALLGQPGGWPLTMFLTPEGEAFWGGTYFPPEPRYGRPGFRDLLRGIAELWEGDRTRLLQNRDAIRDALARLNRPRSGALDAAFCAATADRLADLFDPRHGGLGGAPKFPQAPVLTLLWRTAFHQGRPGLREPVLHTLRRICQGGIYDHLGGGFARYAVDERWLVPHFEKMLYDNGQLLELLAEAFAATGEPLFATRIAETVAWLEREMTTEGGFAASLDADSEGEEGRYYLWTVAEIAEILGGDAADFCAVYGVTPAGNFAGRSILHRLGEEGLRDPAEEDRLAALRARLLAHRSRRVPPARDDKVLADWNGLAVAGLAVASARTGTARYLRLAAAIFDRVTGVLGEQDRLVHAWRAGRRLEQGFLEDYAQMIRAALLLHRCTGDPRRLATAARWAATVEREFRDRDGLLRPVPAGASELPLLPLVARDGPVPSAIAVQAENLAALFHLTGDPEYRRLADATLAAVAGRAREDPHGHAGLLSAFLFAERTVRIALHGRPGEGRFAALHDTALRRAPPAHVVQFMVNDTEAPFCVVCARETCLPPVGRPEDLARQLQSL